MSADPAAADFRRRGADAVLFASSSSARCFVEQGEALRVEKGATRPIHGSIGPQTSETMRAAGLAVDFEAKTPGIDELVEELVRSLS
jgi:uroporphyrinogen III methyltransferase/synthase